MPVKMCSTPSTMNRPAADTQVSGAAKSNVALLASLVSSAW